MANNLKDQLSRRWPSHVAEKFVPTSFWTKDANANDLLHIHLPGFKPDEVRIEVTSDGRIKIEGERIVNEEKCLYMDQSFPLPINSDVDNIVGKFEGEHLYITVPNKEFKEINKEDDNGINENGDSNDENESQHQQTHGNYGGTAMHSHDSSKNGKGIEACRVAEFPRLTINKWEQSGNLLQMGIKCLKRNKGIALSIVISFSIGVWLSNVGI